MKHLRLPARLALVALSACALLGATPLTAAARMEEARPGHRVGIDVSHWQGHILWKQARADGVEFVFAKATEGRSFVDGQYARNQRRTDALGIPFSAYHFARPDRSHRDAVREANHFVRHANLRGRHLLPVLDLELSGGLGQRKLIAWAQAWLGQVEARLGVKPMIYTTPSFWRTYMGDSRWFANNGYRLWIAHWHVDQPDTPARNWAGRGWTFWQLTDCGEVAGIEGCVDVDLFKGEQLGPLTIRRQR